jgi:ribosome biogenesis GTPase
MSQAGEGSALQCGAMSSSDELDALARIGWRAADLVAVCDGEGLRLMRVVAQHRSGYRAHDGHAECAVHAPANLVRAGVDPLQRPAVGDWVLVRPDRRTALIERVLPRRSALVRAAAGERQVAQIIAANVDTVFIVCGLDGDYNPRRIERYLVLVHGSGALPVVVLTKRDLCADAEVRVAEIGRLVGAAGAVLAVNAKDVSTRDALLPFVRAGDTAVLVGSSGAGKSTLTNLLMGESRQKTHAVREHDDRGRHTTTHRALLAIPDGGCLIDTPGMREIKLSGQETLDQGQFADIADLAVSCRFSDCAHQTEPGCRVRLALELGELDPERLASYRKLLNELSATQQAVQAKLKRKAKERADHRALNQRLVEKYGSR